MDNKNQNLKKMPFIIAPKNEIFICKSNKRCTGFICWKLQNTDEENHRRPK